MKPWSVLRFDVEKISEGLGVSVDTVTRIFRTATGSSPVLEERLKTYYTGRKCGQGEGFDVQTFWGSRIEVRGISENGVYFCPAKMVGKHRKFCPEGFKKMLAGLDMFVVADVASFPVVPFWELPASVVYNWWAGGVGLRLPRRTQTTRRKILRMIDKL